MRHVLPLVVLGLSVTVATPVLAALRDLARPSPCDRPIPTGRPVPRQGTIEATSDVLMIGTATPTWRDRPIGLAGNGERVTILQECGWKLRIRNIRGLEGWINTVSIPDERKAYEAASTRPPASIADCDILYIDPVTSDRCKIKFQAEQAHRDEVANSPYLSADELKRLLVGRTLHFVDRYKRPSDHQPPLAAFYAPGGEYFLMQGGPQDNDLKWRGRYELKGDSVCFPRENAFCPRVRRVGDDLIWTAANGKDFTINAEDGDPSGLVAVISKRRPDPVAPAAPQGSEDVAGPRL